MEAILVSGFSMAWNSPPLCMYSKNGAEFSACTTASRGIREINPSECNSRRALPKAETFPRFPPGRTIQSGGFQSRWSIISMTIDFWPSIRNGLIEFTR